MPRTKSSSRLKLKLVPVANKRKPGMRRAVLDDDAWSVGYLTSDDEEEHQNFKLVVIPVAPVVSITPAPRKTKRSKP